MKQALWKVGTHSAVAFLVAASTHALRDGELGAGALEFFCAVVGLYCVASSR